MKTEVKYSSDLTNRQWQLIRQLLPRRSRLGRRPIDRRRIINAILYVVRSGCQWRMLPHDFPPWKTVSSVRKSRGSSSSFAPSSRKRAAVTAPMLCGCGASDDPPPEPSHRVNHPLVPHGEPQMITSARALAELVEQLRGDGSFAYDSEFIGELTYYPRLCLVQAATPRGVWLIDPLGTRGS